MTRGRDDRFRRKPLIVRDVLRPNVLWVNFENPTEPHPAIVEYANNLRAEKSRAMHPSNQPKEDK